MNYRYLPIYKYIIFALIVILFLSYYSQITEEDYLVFILLLTTLYIFLDFATIDEHPSLLNIDLYNLLFGNEEEDEEEERVIEEKFGDEEELNSEASQNSKNRQISHHQRRHMMRQRDGSCMAQ
jgi:hypothetical protein